MPDPHSPALWDTVAASYDARRPDQGLTDAATRAAWRDLLAGLLPAGPQMILDLGCGTGSLSLLLAEAGHTVTGIDFSPVMIAVAREKAARANPGPAFIVADATAPPIPPGSVDAIVCRQTLWALPDRQLALRNWTSLLRDGGSIVLIEGRFASGNGMSDAEIRDAFPPGLTPPVVTDISNEAALWGGPIPDQRLLVTARRTA